MYKLLGDRLILNEELVGTFTKDELIVYLLDELNEIHAELSEILPEYEEMQNTIDDLESEISDLVEELDSRDE